MEWHRAVEGCRDSLLGALVDRKGTESVGIDLGLLQQFLVFNKLLLDPGQPELGLAVVILVSVPAAEEEVLHPGT